jgi:NAD-dependent deacetylase
MRAHLDSGVPRLVVFSGAGLSAESGLPTFRGASGLWEGVPLDIVCNFRTWKQNYDAVHEFYDARREAGSRAQPNDAHHAIATWQKRWPERTVILTQNIDRLLEAAGCHVVIHLHGDIRLLRCVSCRHTWEIAGDRFDRAACPACSRPRSVKPDVVFFNEAAPRYKDLHAVARSLRPADTAVVIGTSGAVLPADLLFGRSPAHSVLINLEPGRQMDESAFRETIYGPASKKVPALLPLLRNRME